jgi:hypothetical protein
VSKMIPTWTLTVSILAALLRGKSPLRRSHNLYNILESFHPYFSGTRNKSKSNGSFSQNTQQKKKESSAQSTVAEEITWSNKRPQYKLSSAFFIHTSMQYTYEDGVSNIII